MTGTRRQTGRKTRSRPRPRARPTSAPHQPKYTKDPSKWRQHLLKRTNHPPTGKLGGGIGGGKPPAKPDHPTDFFPEPPGYGMGKLLLLGLISVALTAAGAILLYITVEFGASAVEDGRVEPGDAPHGAICTYLDFLMTLGFDVKSKSNRAQCAESGGITPGSTAETSKEPEET